MPLRLRLQNSLVSCGLFPLPDGANPINTPPPLLLTLVSPSLTCYGSGRISSDPTNFLEKIVFRSSVWVGLIQSPLPSNFRSRGLGLDPSPSWKRCRERWRTKEGSS